MNENKAEGAPVAATGAGYWVIRWNFVSQKLTLKKTVTPSRARLS